MGMTLDQQLTKIISAARRQIMAQFDERTNSLAGETHQAAAVEQAAAIRDVLLAAETQIVACGQEAAAAAQADAAKQIDEAAATARMAALAAARVEADQRVAAAVAAATLEAEAMARQATTRAAVESQAAARQSELAQIDRVVEAVRRFDRARSLTEVLDALGEATSCEAPRVALFLVRHGRLAGWRATGFGPTMDPHAIDVASDDTSLLWRAVSSGLALSTTDAPAGDRWMSPFGHLGLDAVGFAVPVRVGGETVAVVYADDATEGPRAVPSAWPEVVEVLSRHAGRCLEVLTLSKTAAPSAPASPRPLTPRGPAPERVAPAARAEDDESARRYARLLVSEIKLYHEAAVTEGRQGHNLMARLGTEIERARKLYEERVPSEIRNRVDLFGEELVHTLANGDPALLGATRP